MSARSHCLLSVGLCSWLLEFGVGLGGIQRKYFNSFHVLVFALGIGDVFPAHAVFFEFMHQWWHLQCWGEGLL